MNAIETDIKWNGKETLEFFLQPIFIGENPLDTQGIKVMTDIQSKKQLNYFGTLQKITKKYTKGFNGSSGAEYTQRTIEVVQLEAEIKQDANVFYQTVYETAQKKGWEWNVVTGTIMGEIVAGIFRDALQVDAFRMAWLNDVNKETVVNDLPSGVADEDYDAFPGFWSRFIADSKLVTDGDFNADLDIRRYIIESGGTTGISTITFTGTGGTADITINNVPYLATFATDLDVTAANFVSLHKDALLLRGIIITNAPATEVVDVTTVATGFPIDIASDNVSGDLDSTLAEPTPAVLATDPLASDEALGTFRAMWKLADPTLKQQKQRPSSDVSKGGTNDGIGMTLAFWVTDSILENYIESLEDTGATEQAYSALINGVPVAAWRKIPVLSFGWDQYLEADFINTYPHRALLSVRDNIIYGVDAVSEQSKAEIWYEKKDQDTLYRIQYKAGTQYAFARYIVAGF